MKPKLIVDEIELGTINNRIGVVRGRGRIISKHKIHDLDALAYNQIFIDLNIDRVM